MALQKMLGQKKVFQIQPKSSQDTQGEHNRPFFNQKLPSKSEFGPGGAGRWPGEKSKIWQI
jgi:hypothetical protein